MKTRIILIIYGFSRTKAYSIYSGIQYERIDYNISEKDKDNYAVYYIYEHNSEYNYFGKNIYFPNKTYNPPYIRYVYNDRFWIYEDDEFYNIILPYYLAVITGKYEHLLDRFADEGDTAFMREVCEWLGTTFSEDMVEDEHFSEESKSKTKDTVKILVASKLAPYIDKPELEKEEVVALECELVEIVTSNKLTGRKESGKIQVKNEKNGKGERMNLKSNINHILEYFDLPYTLMLDDSKYSWVENNDQKHES